MWFSKVKIERDLLVFKWNMHTVWKSSILNKLEELLLDSKQQKLGMVRIVAGLDTIRRRSEPRQISRGVRETPSCTQEIAWQVHNIVQILYYMGLNIVHGCSWMQLITYLTFWSLLSHVKICFSLTHDIVKKNLVSSLLIQNIIRFLEFVTWLDGLECIDPVGFLRVNAWCQIWCL